MCGGPRPRPRLMTPLDRRLAQFVRTHPGLESALTLQAALLRQTHLMPEPPRVQPFPLPPSRTRHKAAHGTPLLHDEPAFLDVRYAAELFARQLNVLVGGLDEGLSERATAIARAATTGLLNPEQLFGEAFVQHADHVQDLAVRAGVEPDLLAMLASAAVGPLLRAHSERLMPLLGPGWQRGYCPVCGAWPVLAELRGADRARHLRCGDCGSDWTPAGPACVYCGNADPTSFRTLQPDDEPRVRVEACDRCHGFLKAFVTLEALPAELLTLEDLASVHLDTAANERGYQRPSGPGFRIELALPEDELAEELASLD
jgi:FdhE protein